MNFLIAKTFTKSFAKLTGDEQKAVKITFFDLLVNPTQPSACLQKLKNSKDRHFWYLRASDDLRIIVHRNSVHTLLCYVDHHEDAFKWAKTHVDPKTDAEHLIEVLVEVRQTVQEITVPGVRDTTQEAAPKQLPLAGIGDHPGNGTAGQKALPRLPLAGMSNSVLLSCGVPVDRLDDVRRAYEDNILEMARHLPEEAGEVLLNLAIGSTSPMMRTDVVALVPSEPPEPQRRFAVLWKKLVAVLRATLERVKRWFNSPGGRKGRRRGHGV